MSQFRPGGFQVLPLVIKNLLIINGLVYLAQMAMQTQGYETEMMNLFALHHFQSPLFNPYQLISHLFMHSTQNFAHLLFNMFALWMFGSVLENHWGPKRFLIFYVVSGIGAAVIHLSFLAYGHGQFMHDVDIFYQNATAENFMSFYNNQVQSNFAGTQYSREARLLANAWLENPELTYEYKRAADQFVRMAIQSRDAEPTVGASGAVFGCLAAFGYLFPNSYIYLYFFLPIKVKWFVLGYAAVELVLAIQNSAGDNVAHWAHLGGALVGFLLVLYWNKTDRRSFY